MVGSSALFIAMIFHLLNLISLYLSFAFATQVAMVGSSALACAVLPMICHNVTLDEQFDKTVTMWVHDANLTHEVRLG